MRRDQRDTAGLGDAKGWGEGVGLGATLTPAAQRDWGKWGAWGGHTWGPGGTLALRQRGAGGRGCPGTGSTSSTRPSLPPPPASTPIGTLVPLVPNQRSTQARQPPPPAALGSSPRLTFVRPTPHPSSAGPLPNQGAGLSLTPQIYSFDFPGFKRHKRRRLGPAFAAALPISLIYGSTPKRAGEGGRRKRRRRAGGFANLQP